MESTKVCPNGHRYRAEMLECPFCPKAGSSLPTVVDDRARPPVRSGVEFVQPASGEPCKTKVDSQAAPGGQVSAKSPGGASAARRTVILDGGAADPSSSPQRPLVGATQGKLIGWLVTFTWNPLGDDYRIRTGKTRVGSAADNDISLPDGQVSSLHCELVFRSGELKIRDAFSTNGTFVNGEDISDTPTILQNGDEIRIGGTIFKIYLI